MAKYTVILAALTLFASGAAAVTAPEWGQCGGINFTGPTTCPVGWTCVVHNAYFSQCLVVDSTTDSATGTATSSAASGTVTTTVPW